MRAMVLSAQAAVETAPLASMDRPMPEPAAGEVRVRVRACGACRTDLHVVEGDLPARRLPLIPGHQVVGTVDALGPGAARFRVGDRIGMAHLALGDLERAEAELRTASGFAERGGERGSEGWLRLERAQLAHRRADRSAARGELQKAMAIATELGMRPLIHRCEQSLTALG